MTHLPIASSGSFLVTPNVGIMIWTLVVFAISLVILNKAVFPRIRDALDARQRAIVESIEAAERTRKEAEQLLAEYRERLQEAREHAEQILSRAQKTAQTVEARAREEAEAKREEALERTRREIEAETRRAIAEIRREVADLTVEATEKLTRKTLNPEDQRRLVQEALEELDFDALTAGAEAN
ncbi:MAG TPA: F0F1 ATP synthase subunit B [Solirubrobacteraceae bacterium]|nr:F0F1 ATP synthase subunit B [Solirubrobacteraceae bacterium]